MEQLKPNVHESLARAGYLSVFADSIERQSVPRVLRYTSPRLMQYNATAWRDEELLPEKPGEAVDLTPLHKDIERLSKEAGLYQLIYSTEGMAHPKYRHLLTEIAQTLKRIDTGWLQVVRLRSGGVISTASKPLSNAVGILALYCISPIKMEKL